jgi:hypothetical protein
MARTSPARHPHRRQEVEMIDDTPLTFAEAIEICRSRPIGYAGTEVVDDLLDEFVAASRNRWHRSAPT